MGYRFYNHKKAVKYCKRNIFLIKALYSAAIPLLVVELVGVILATVPIAILVPGAGRFFGLLFAAIVVNSMVIFPAMLIFVLYKQTTVNYVADIALEFNGPPIIVLKDACATGLRESEVLELTKLLMDNGHIKDYRILRGALLVKNSITLSEQEINGYLYLGVLTKEKSKKGVTKKIVYELPDTGADEFCDNCGKVFEKDDSFCGYCGTMRKDLRRRI